MENYEILKTEPKGCYGYVHIVKHRGDGKTYAIKTIECMDETTANQGLKEVSAMSVCMVMEYSSVGDLASFIQGKRQRKEKIREMVIKNFVGQMVDGLVFLHFKQVPHRNLKPTNILLLTDLSFAICDFVVPVFVSDEVKFKIRMKEYSKLWMSPETVERLPILKSDIWSTGCILLEMMTCSMMDENDYEQLVKVIRNDWKSMNYILEKLHVEKKYTVNLCNLVQHMLEPDPAIRTSVTALLDLQYVKESLVICGSPLSGTKKSPMGTEQVPFGEGVDKLLEFMLLQIDVEEIQKIALKYITYLLYESEVLEGSERMVPVLISIMEHHKDCLELQARVCRILLKSAMKATENSIEEGVLFSDTVINVILSIMESRQKYVELQQVICNLLMVLAGSEAAAKLIGKANGIQTIMRTLRMYIDNSHVCIPCCGALWSLVVIKENAQIAKSEGSLHFVLQVLEKHIQNGDVVESASAAVWALSLHESLNDEQLEDITLLLIEAFELHLRKETIVKNICFALASLIRMSELVAFRILVPENDRDGLALIIQSYHKHFTDPEVVQDICMVCLELVQYEDVLPELLSQKLDVTLNSIKIKFASNEDILILVDSTLSKLQRIGSSPEDTDVNSSVVSI
ncbi:serine/threonine kinase-like domain-containing protein STKLD1 isoform X2 [Scyliorhinus canicula]|uniref:serine/threonine kinase-like domain-containing protein STKLD1 isoform X2 n=1 Tax=Scyliorhinus canicula TaxID=7830 RepID=UPI0018F74A95|nr:serine/threonine kinase-like domain-containing protein STKLD1 isoform X2 [Scyliorhinus canicula]